MKIWQVKDPGGNFAETEIVQPRPAANQVLVRIHASGVNPLDTKIRAAKATHARQPLPGVLGVDMAGVVEDTGVGVRAFQPGDEVYGMVGGTGGVQGTLAEAALVDVDLLARKPRIYRCVRPRPFRSVSSRLGKAWLTGPKCVRTKLY